MVTAPILSETFTLCSNIPLLLYALQKALSSLHDRKQYKTPSDLEQHLVIGM